MGAGDLEILDILLTTGDDDEPRLKVGDHASGDGVGQDCAFLASDGFVSMPNGPDDAGGAGQAVCWTPGNDRIVIACADGRYNAKAGTLAPGDRAIVSNCDAAFKLSQAGNKVRFFALAQGMELTLDAALQRVSAKVGLNEMRVSTTFCSLVFDGGGAITCDASGITLQIGALLLNMSGVAVSIATLGGPPAQLLINGTPVTVP